MAGTEGQRGGNAVVVAVIAAMLVAVGACATTAAFASARLQILQSSAAAPPCPLHSTGEVARTRWLAARRTLFPPGAVSVRVCRYNGDIVGALKPAHAKSVLLGQARSSNATVIANLSSLFNRLGLDPRFAHSCPDEDIAFVVFAAYASSHRLAIGVNSCLLVSNGGRARASWIYARPISLSLITDLVRLTGGNPAPWQGR